MARPVQFNEKVKMVEIPKGYSGEGFFATTFDKAIGAARKNSIWPLPFATSCCGIEFMTRCILCYRCVFTADQLTQRREHGILGRGEHVNARPSDSAHEHCDHQGLSEERPDDGVELHEGDRRSDIFNQTRQRRHHRTSRQVSAARSRERCGNAVGDV